MTLAADLLDIVLDDISPKVVDTILTSNLALQILQSRVVKVTGKNKQYPVRVSKQNNAIAFEGFDLLNTNYVNKNTKLSFLLKNVTIPVVLADTDIASAQGTQAVIDFVVEQTEEATQELAEFLGGLLYLDGTTYSSKAPDGFRSAIKTSGTYGGLDYSTYTTLQATVNSSTALAALTIALMDTMYAAISSGNNVPTHILTTKAVFQKIKTLLTIANFASNASMGTNMGMTKDGGGALLPGARPGIYGSFGFTELFYNGIPIIADEQCPAGYMFFLNINTWDLLVQEMPSSQGYTPIKIQSNVITGQYDMNVEKTFNGFSRSPAVRAINQLGTVAHIVFRGNLVCNNPKRNGMFSVLT